MAGLLTAVFYCTTMNKVADKITAGEMMSAQNHRSSRHIVDLGKAGADKVSLCFKQVLQVSRHVFILL